MYLKARAAAALANNEADKEKALKSAINIQINTINNTKMIQ